MLLAGKNFENNLLLAPLAGFSDVGFRAVCSLQGAEITFSEMLSAQALKYDSKKTKDMTIVHPYEKFKIAQIFGHDPLSIAEAVNNEALSMFDGIDINFGCPAPKIVKNGDGSALLKNLTLLSKIICEVKKATTRPVSAKVRIGYDKNNVIDIVRACEDGGADFVTVHGRTKSQGYSGVVDLEAIATAKSFSSIPVIGNGDVKDVASYKNMLSTNVDGVMIGRGAVGRPWIFSELSFKKVKNVFDLIIKHVDILKENYPEKWLTLYLRKHFLAYANTFGAKAETKRFLSTSQSIDESLKKLNAEFKHFDISQKSSKMLQEEEE